MSGARPRTGDVAPDGRIYIRLDEEDDVPPPEKPPFECALCCGTSAGWERSLTGKPICFGCAHLVRVPLYRVLGWNDDCVVAEARSVIKALEDECARHV